MVKNGHIHKGSHEGFYSTNEETFFPEKDLQRTPDGSLTVPATGEVCDFVTEENYIFKFDEEMKKKLVAWATEAIEPAGIRNKILADLVN